MPEGDDTNKGQAHREANGQQLVPAAEAQIDDFDFLAGIGEEEGLLSTRAQKDKERKRQESRQKSYEKLGITYGEKEIKNKDEILKNENKLSEIGIGLIEPPVYKKKGFVIDNGKLRERKGIIKEVYRRINEGQFVVGDQLKDYIKEKAKEIGDPLYHSKQEFYTPLKIDPDKRIGGYYPVQVDDEYLNDEQKSDPTFKKNLGKTGFFDENKIKFSNVDLNTAGTLIDDSSLKDTKAKWFAKKIINYKTGKLSFISGAERRAIKSFNKKYGKDEEDHSSNKKKRESEFDVQNELNLDPVTDQMESDKKEPKWSVADDIGSKYDDKIKKSVEAAIKYIHDIIKLVPKGKVSMPFFKLTSKGIILDVKTSLESKQIGNPTMTSTFDIKFGEIFSLNYIGSEITNIPKLNISIFNSGIRLKASVDSLISDKSQGDHLFKATNPEMYSDVGDQEMSLSANEISFNTQNKTFSGKGISGSLDLSFFDYTFNGEIRSLDFTENIANTGLGVGKLNELNLTNHFKAENIAATYGLFDEKQELIADGEVGIKNIKTDEINVKNISGRIISNFEKIGDNNWELKGTDLENGELNAHFFGSDITIRNIKYLSDKEELSASKFDWAGNLFAGTPFETTASLSFLKPSFSTQNGFTFDKAEGKINGELDSNLGVKVTDPTVIYVPGHVILAKGEIKGGVEAGGVKFEGRGNASFAFDTTEQHQLRNVMVNEGSMKIDALGWVFKLTGVSGSTSGIFNSTNASATGKILGKEIEVKAKNTTYGNGELTFDKAEGKINGELDSKLGVKVTDPTLIYVPGHVILAKGKITGTGGEEKDGVKFEGGGDISLAFDTTEQHQLRNVMVNEGSMKINALGWVFNLTGVSGSTTGIFNSTEASATGNILGNDVTLSGTGVSYSKNKGLDFKELSVESNEGKEIDAKIFKVTPEKFTLVKNDLKKYGAKAEGKIDFSFPESLGIRIIGKVEGVVELKNIKTPSAVTNSITSANVAIWAKNPLFNLAKILGLSEGANGQITVDASIPVFPAIAATFGFYLTYGASFPEYIKGGINMAGNNLVVSAIYGLNAGVEAGVFAGVKAGSDLIVSLALILKAGGGISLVGDLGFEKSFSLKETPKEDEGDKKQGLKYSLEGDVYLRSSVEAIATALYFFQKKINKPIGEKSLGSFSFTEKEGLVFNEKTDDLVSKQELEEEVKPELREEYEKLQMDSKKLLEYDFSKRFEPEEKDKVLDTLKKGHKAYENEKKDGTYADWSQSTDWNRINRRVEGQIAFNDTWYENLKGTNTFIDKRCNWPIIFKIFEKEAKFKDSTLVREDMSLLGKNINLVGNFVTYYGKKVEGFEKNYSEILKAVLVTPQITEYSGLINKKKKMIDELESFKEQFLHSRRKGDDNLQESNMDKTKRLLIFDSKYEKYKKKYLKVKKTIKDVNGEEVNSKLSSFHSSGSWLEMEASLIERSSF